MIFQIRVPCASTRRGMDYVIYRIRNDRYANIIQHYTAWLFARTHHTRAQSILLVASAGAAERDAAGI